MTMTRSIAVILAVMLIAAKVGAAPEPMCLESSVDCVRSSECCSGCCLDSECVEYAGSCQSDLAKLDAGKGGPSCVPPCKLFFMCVLHQATCVQGPCKPVSYCAPQYEFENYE